MTVVEGIVLQATGLTKTYLRGAEVVQALRGSDLTVYAGEILGVSGASGSGKSTMLAVLCGWERPDEGVVEHAVGAVATLAWSELAIVPQTRGLLEDLTVQENVELAGRLVRPRRAEHGRAPGLLDRLGIGHLAHRLPTTISVGEQQRTALARALYLRPPLLLADEPTAHQDHGWGQVVLETLRDHANSGAAIVMVSHEEQALALCDRRLTMIDGALR